MNLKSLKKYFPKDYAIKIKKLTVRECDEEEPGFYIAYVDEGKETYDLNADIDEKLEVINSTCDCDEGHLLCFHQIALLEHLKKLLVKPKTKRKAVRKSQNSEIRDMIADIPGPELLEWLEEILKKNKELQIDFKLKFAQTSHKELDLDEILKTSKEVIKSVVGRKKTIEPAKVKVIIDFWKKLHQPYFDSVYIAPNSLEQFRKYADLFRGIWEFSEGYFFQGKRLEGYLKLRQKELAKSIASLQNKAPIFDILKDVDDGGKQLIPDVLNLFGLLFEFLIPEEKELFLKSLFEGYDNLRKKGKNIGEGYTLFLYRTLETKELEEKYLHFLLPVQYENEYNLHLLHHLIELEDWIRVEHYCKWIISTNHYEQYNFPYYNILKDVYEVQGEKKNRLELLKNLLPLQYDFKDFLEIFESIKDPKEQIKFRASILSKAVNAINYDNYKAASFCFQLMHHDKNYRRLIKYVPDFCPVYLLEPMWESLVLNEPFLLVKNVIFGQLQGYSWNIDRAVKEKDQLLFSQLFKILEKHISIDQLRAGLAASGYNQWRKEDSFASYCFSKLKK